jgi:hypothetical protein
MLAKAGLGLRFNEHIEGDGPTDLTYRFPLIVEALARLRSRSCIIDGKGLVVLGNAATDYAIVGRSTPSAGGIR